MQIWKLCDRSNPNSPVSTGRNGLAQLAVYILSVVPNSAAVERIFSDFGITHTKLRNCLSTENIHKISVLRMHLHRQLADAGLLPLERPKRKLGDDYEPTTMPVAAITNDDQAIPNFRDIGDALVNEAIDTYAEGREDDDIVSDSEHDLPVPGDGTASNAELAPPLSPNPLAPSTTGLPLILTESNIHRPPEPPRRGRKPRKPKAFTVPLHKLFRYPELKVSNLSEPLSQSTTTSPSGSGSQPQLASAPGPSPLALSRSPSVIGPFPTSPAPPTAEAGLNMTALERFEYLWMGGIRQYEQETEICELLHSSVAPSTPSSTASTSTS